MSKVLFRLTALIAAMALIGCSSGDGGAAGKVATVSGKVTVNGAILTGGSITFTNKAGDKTGTSEVKSDGTYECPTAPMGENLIGIDNSTLQASGPPMAAMPGMPPPNKYMKIDPKYYKPATSGLTLNVDKSRMTHDIDLK